MTRLRDVWGGAAVVAVALAVVALLLNLWFGAATCNEEGESCIESRELVLYQGRVFDLQGRPLSRARLGISLPTLEEPGASSVRVRMSADSAGRFCFRRWQEPRAVSIEAIDGTPRAPADPRFRDPGRILAGRTRYGPDSRLLVVPPGDVRERITGATRYVSGDVRRVETLVYEGTITTSTGWDRARDAAGRCPVVARAPRWDRFEDLERNWRYRVLVALPVGVLVLIAAGGLAGGRVGRRLVIVALVGACADAALFGLIWYLRVL